MSTQPSLPELARARLAGWEDVARGLTVDDYPFEFAVGSLHDAWLDGYKSHAVKARQATSDHRPALPVLNILGVTAISVFGAALSISLLSPRTACAFGLLYGAYLGFHLGRRTRESPRC